MEILGVAPPSSKLYAQSLSFLSQVQCIAYQGGGNEACHGQGCTHKPLKSAAKRASRWRPRCLYWRTSSMENLCLAGITSTVMTRQQEKCTARFLTVVKKKLRWPLKLQVRLLRGDSAFVTSHFDCFNIKKQSRTPTNPALLLFVISIQKCF